MRRSSDSVARPVVAFALLSVLALALVAGSGLLVIHRLADEQALSEARQLTDLSARIVDRRVDEGLLTGDAESLAAVASVVFDAVRHDPVVRVKIWSPTGQILYSDEPRLIGHTYRLGPEEQDVLAHGGVVAEVSDLQAPENRYERSFGQLMEVYARIRTPKGTPLLFETYQLRSSITGNGRALAGTFTPVLVVTLIALALILLPLAWLLARRVRRTQSERERLMQRAIESSDRERRRIAADLHDGPVQELSGLSMQLSAAAQNVQDPSSSETLRDSASAVRGSVKTLRIGDRRRVSTEPAAGRTGGSPVGPRRASWNARGSSARWRSSRTRGSHRRSTSSSTGPRRRRCATSQEHAEAGAVQVAVRRRQDRAVLEVRDDGHGIAPQIAAQARAGGHMGLQILADMVRDAGGDAHRQPGRAATWVRWCAWRCRPDDPRGARRRPPGRAGGARATAGDLRRRRDRGIGRRGRGRRVAVPRRAPGRPAARSADARPWTASRSRGASRRSRRTTRVVVFTSFSDRDGILRALDAGAIGYLLKDAEPEEIHEAIRAASRGEAPHHPARRRRAARRPA